MNTTDVVNTDNEEAGRDRKAVVTHLAAVSHATGPASKSWRAAFASASPKSNGGTSRR